MKKVTFNLNNLKQTGDVETITNYINIITKVHYKQSMMKNQLETYPLVPSGLLNCTDLSKSLDSNLNYTVEQEAISNPGEPRLYFSPPSLNQTFPITIANTFSFTRTIVGYEVFVCYQSNIAGSAVYG